MIERMPVSFAPSPFPVEWFPVEERRIPQSGELWAFCPEIGNREEGYGYVVVARYCDLSLAGIAARKEFERRRATANLTDPDWGNGWVDLYGRVLTGAWRVTHWAWVHKPEPPILVSAIERASSQFGGTWGEGLPPEKGWYDVIEDDDDGQQPRRAYLQPVSIPNSEPFTVWGWSESDDPEVLDKRALWRGPVARPADADEW